MERLPQGMSLGCCNQSVTKALTRSRSVDSIHFELMDDRVILPLRRLAAMHVQRRDKSQLHI